MIPVRLWSRFTLGRTFKEIPNVAGDLAGERIFQDIDGYRVEILFENSLLGDVSLVDRETQVATTGFMLPHIDVYTDKLLDSDDDLAGSLRDAFDACAKSAALVSDTCRISQPSTGLAGIFPILDFARADIDGKWSDPILFIHYRVSAMVSGWPRPDLHDMRRTLDRKEVDLAAVLLAQASNSAMSNPDSSNGVAVVLAAIACEMKIKQCLTELSSDEKRALVNLIIPTKGRALLPVYELFKKVAAAVFGRSLFDEDPALFHRYQKLAEERNLFAHRGIEIHEKEAWAHVVTARNVFTWIDSLP
jgi:hypothetical protein